MNNIVSSASKIVLLSLVAVLAVATLFSAVHDVLFGEFNEVTKIVLVAFSNALSMVFGFYFAYKGTDGGQVSSQTTVSEDGSSQVNTQTTSPPYAGK